VYKRQEHNPAFANPCREKHATKIATFDHYTFISLDKRPIHVVQLPMSDLYWLTDEQMAELSPFVPKSRGQPHVDDRRALSGIIFTNRDELSERDAPPEHGSAKTLYSRWKRWSEKGIFARMPPDLADQGGETETFMIDATHLKTHSTATSMRLREGVRGCPIGRTKGGRTRNCRRSLMPLVAHCGCS